MSSQSGTQCALLAHHLNVQAGMHPLVVDASLRLARGSWVCICGPNGAGKSTLLKALAQLSPCTGKVQLMAQNVDELKPAQLARHLSWMGQAQPVPVDLTVTEVVELGRWPYRHDPGLNGTTNADVVHQCLTALGLEALADRPLGELSGGECQRALLARAMAVQAPIMLFDEPLNHLDLPYQQQWLKWLRLRCQQGAAALTVMHELNQAMAADELLVMRTGRVLHQGTPQDPQTQEALQEAFGLKLQFHGIDTHETKPRWVVLSDPDSCP
jgi:iron complex transport system ATP-binding protein